MPHISYKDYGLAHGGPSRKVVPTSKWKPIDKVIQAGENLVQRETRLDIERVASKVDNSAWSEAMTKALVDMKKLAGSLLVVLALSFIAISMAG